MAPLTLAGTGCPPPARGSSFAPPWSPPGGVQGRGGHPSSLLGAHCASPHCSHSAPQHWGAMGTPSSAPWYECAMGTPLVSDVMGTTSSASASTPPLPWPSQPGCNQAPCESRNFIFGAALALQGEGDTREQVVTRDRASTGCVAPIVLQKGGVQVSPRHPASPARPQHHLELVPHVP